MSEKKTLGLSTITSNDLRRADASLQGTVTQLKNDFERVHPGFVIVVNDVTRSAKDQQAAFKRGFSTIDGTTQVGKHNYYPSMAVDLNIRSSVDGSAPPKAVLHQLYSSLGEMGEEKGLRWGGRWTVPYDPYHFELPQRGPLSPRQAIVPHVAEVGDAVQYLRTSGQHSGVVETVIDPSALPDGTPNGKPTYLIRQSDGKLVVVPSAGIKVGHR